MNRYLSTFLLIIFLAGSFGSAAAQYVKKDEIFTAGQQIAIRKSNADSLLITYRPGSNISSTQKIALTKSTYWTPQKAGIYALSTTKGPSQTVSVRFSQFPLAGFVVLVVAAFILFGGAIFASVNLFGKKSAAPG